MNIDDINSNTIYYVVLYLIVIINRIYKVKKINSDKTWGREETMQVCSVGQDLLYSASGVVILLIQDFPKFTSAILICYVFILLIITPMDNMEKQFKPITVLIVNLIISAFIVLSTVLYFQQNYKDKNEYKVSIPYKDLALKQYLGAKYENRNLSYFTMVSASDKYEAIKVAKNKMKSDVRVFDVKNRVPNFEEDIIPVEEKITLENIYLSRVN